MSETNVWSGASFRACARPFSGHIAGLCEYFRNSEDKDLIIGYRVLTDQVSPQQWPDETIIAQMKEYGLEDPWEDYDDPDPEKTTATRVEVEKIADILEEACTLDYCWLAACKIAEAIFPKKKVQEPMLWEATVRFQGTNPRHNLESLLGRGYEVMEIVDKKELLDPRS